MLASSPWLVDEDNDRPNTEQDEQADDLALPRATLVSVGDIESTASAGHLEKYGEGATPRHKRTL